MKRVATAGARPLTRDRAEVDFASHDALRIVAVADTHSRPHARAHELIRGLAPHAILHAGDIGDLDVLDGLADIAPVFAVRGNIDGRAPGPPDVLTVDLKADGKAQLTILVFHIALAGPRVRADAAKLVRELGAGLLVCGHSHVPFIGVDRGIAVLNPGSIGPRRFSLPIVFGVIDVPRAGSVRLHHVSCETGERWLP